VYIDEFDLSFFAKSPFLVSLDINNALLCRFWQTCDLCIYVEHRLGKILDPRLLKEAEILQLEQEALTQYDCLSNPCKQESYSLPFWIRYHKEIVGIVKLDTLPVHGPKIIYIWNLYLFPEHRRQDIGHQLLDNLYELAIAHGFAGIRVKTEWMYQSAVQFYLDIGLWVIGWKHNLDFGRLPDLPSYRFELQNKQALFWVNSPDSEKYQLFYTAHNKDGYLVLEEQALVDEDYMLEHCALCTFSLCLAQNGFPLVASQAEWEEEMGWCDGAMPVCLAYKIEVWEAYERKQGFLVNTPKIPGLQYRKWDELMKE